MQYKTFKKQKNLLYHNSCYAMGTRLNVLIVGQQPDFSAGVFKSIQHEVLRLEKKLSRFDQSSQIYQINQTASKSPVNIDSEMLDILSLCIDYYNRTDGAFDVTLTSVSNLHEKYIKHTNLSELIQLNNNSSKVSFSSPNTKLDLGGFGKGYALKKIESILIQNNIENALVSFGESSILALGHHPHGDCWKIGIQNIYESNSCAYVFDLRDTSISTSGFQSDTHLQPNFHILNPSDAQPVQEYKNIVVESNNCLDAEILSTALYAVIGESALFLDNFKVSNIISIEYENNKLLRVDVL